MRVQKRNGQYENISFDKILIRLRNLSFDLNVNVDAIAQKVINHLKDGIQTKELDELAARISTTLMTEHPDYGTLGSRIIISNHHKNTSSLFSEKMEELYLHYDFKGNHCPIINKELYEMTMKHQTLIDSTIDYNRDYQFDYFAFKTLERSYLLKIQDKKIIERPQDMFMRVSLALHPDNLNKALKSYDLMSQKYFTHASPTLFNAGGLRQQLSSCFVENTEVVTINDGVKFIQDVKVGDLVVTHKNQIKKVLQVHKNPLNQRKIKKLTVVKSKPIFVTNNHRFWAISKQNKQPKWMSVDELNTDCYVGIPNVNMSSEDITIDITTFLIPEILEKCEINEDSIRIVNHIYNEKYKNKSNLMIIRSNYIQRHITLSQEFLNFIGVFIGDGHIITNNKKIRGIGFTIHNINENLVNFISRIGFETFGIKPSFHFMKSQNITQVLFSSEILGNLFKSLCGQYFNGKELHSIFFKMSRSHIESLFAGIITSDGCMTLNGNCVIQMSNKQIINQLYHLGRMHNIDLSFRKVKKPETWKYKQPYSLSLSRIHNIVEKTNKLYKEENNRKTICSRKELKNNYTTPIIINNNKFLKVKSIENTDLQPEFVYTLGIEDDHSYTVEGLLCENCFLLSTDDSIEGIYKTITDCAKISKWAGGIGVHISNIRSKNALIRGTNGKTSGIVPMLRVYNDTALFVNQCFVPETIIYTRDGPKQICDITTNDFVITKDGTFKPVNQVIKNHVSKNILEIRTQQSFEPLYVTNEHELYVLKGQNKELGYSLIKNRLDKGLIKPQFIPASQLEENDLVCYPEIQNLDEGVEDDDLDFYRIVGILLGDGYITKKKTGEYYEYGITVNRDSKIETYNFVKQFLTFKNIHFWECEQINSVQIRWSTNIGVSKEDIYDENKEKYIHSKFFNLSKQQTLQLIKGLIETDGSNLKELYFYSSSYKLAHGLRYLLLKLGVPSSGNIKDNIGQERILYEPYERTIITLRIPKAKILEEIIDFPQKGRYYKYFKHDNMIWSRIKKIDSVYYEGDVFDLNIQDNHNYVVGSFGLVHNSGKRNGSFAIYLEPHHPDVLEFLDIRKNHGDELQRARDLFTAMWLNNLFFERVKADALWSLFDPDECPGLTEAYGDEYKQLYEKYEQEQKYRKQIKARDLWKAMIVSQIETGTPYVLNKDACNEKTNQKNIGTIKSSNLCVSGDTMILTDNGEIEIKKCKNQTVKVWNGREFSETTIHQTGINQELLKLTFSNGSELKCTPYHKFYTKNNDKIEAKLLKVGQELETFFYPNNNQPQTISLTSMEFLEEKEDTFCFTEPKLGKGMFNKILTGNCAEIVEYSDNNEYAVCVLSSVCLPKFVENGQFNHQKLFEIMQVVVDNLNNVIDKNYYPVPETENSNMKHRPLGIGVQGLADVYAQLRMPFDSLEAKQLNKEIFETMYYAALYASCEQSKEYGPYSTFQGSPLSQGQFQYNLWGLNDSDLTERWNWQELRNRIKNHGVRNSLLIALMPTASTSQIMGNNESFECYTTNIYSRTTLAGDFVLINKYLINDLINLGLWSSDMKDKIIYHQGSIQSIEEIPKNIRELYKTVWEISQKHVIDQASDRGPFVCQSQSMNLYFQNPSYAKISSALLYGYSKGLKTLSYYTRSKTAVAAQQFSLDAEKVKQIIQNQNTQESCESCSG